MKKLEAQKKAQGANAKDGNSGLTTDKRLDRDADIMRKKQEDAARKKAEQEAATAAAAKKVVKVDPLKL